MAPNFGSINFCKKSNVIVKVIFCKNVMCH